MNIVTAIDFSDTTSGIISVTRKMAKVMNASVCLVHVAAPNPDFVGYEAGPDVVRDQVAREYREEHTRLQGLAQELRDQGIKTKALLVQGGTAESLLEQAHKQQCDILIVGSHGRGAVADLIVGSVSGAIIRSAKCPVTVVPPGFSNP